jgi:pumilio family protein 6
MAESKGHKRKQSADDSAEQDFVKLEREPSEDQPNVDGEERTKDSAGSAAAKAKALKQRADKKTATVERKKRKPSYDLLKEAKIIWEELRQKDLEKSKRQVAYERLMALIGGKVAELVLKHDASRIVQTAVKYAAPEGRTRILSELKGHMVELSKSHYGRFLVQKLLLHGTKEQRAKIMQEFYGKVVSLIKHKESVAVIDYAYASIASTAQKRFLVQEFYGPEYAIFKDETVGDLDTVLAAHPERRSKIAAALGEHVQVLIEKKLLLNVITHRVLLDCLQLATPAQRDDLVDSLKEELVAILHTWEGAQVAMQVVAASTAKQRKAILKSFKTFAVKIACEEYGHLVLLRLLDSTDDTVLVRKTLYPELLPAMPQLVVHPHGRFLPLHLLLPAPVGRYYAPRNMQLLAAHPPQHTKKDPVARRAELLADLRPALHTAVVGAAATLLTSVACSAVVEEYLTWLPQDDPARDELLDAIAAAADSRLPEEAGGELLLNHLHGSRVLKRLLKGCPSLAARLAERLSAADHAPPLADLAASKGAPFVLLALLESQAPAAQEIAKRLKPVAATLQKSAEQGAQILGNHLLGKPTGHANGKRTDAENKPEKGAARPAKLAKKSK